MMNEQEMNKLKKAIVLALFAIALASCKDKSVNQQGDYAIGKYLYMDFHHRLHTNKDCLHIGDAVEFLDTVSIYAKTNINIAKTVLLIQHTNMYKQYCIMTWKESGYMKN